MIPLYNSAPSKFARPIPVIPDDILSFLNPRISYAIPKETKTYDSSTLSSLSNLSSELLANVNDAANAASQAAESNAANDAIANKFANKGSDMDTSDTSEGNLLSMIFKIVPIGVNVAKKGKTIVQGLKETSMGIVDMIKNTAILTGLIGIDTILFFIELCIYLFKLLICVVEKMFNFPKCVIFYIIDVFILCLLAAIVSVLFIIDVILMPKKFVGKSCVEMFIMLLIIFEQIDRFVYKLVSVHLIHYPDNIMDMCYNCVAMRNTQSFKNAASRWLKDIFIRIPTDIGGPIGDTVTGIGHIFSFFSL
jgi:hypothetical protein